MHFYDWTMGSGKNVATVYKVSLWCVAAVAPWWRNWEKHVGILEPGEEVLCNGEPVAYGRVGLGVRNQARAALLLAKTNNKEANMESRDIKDEDSVMVRKETVTLTQPLVDPRPPLTHNSLKYVFYVERSEG